MNKINLKTLIDLSCEGLNELQKRTDFKHHQELELLQRMQANHIGRMDAVGKSLVDPKEVEFTLY